MNILAFVLFHWSLNYLVLRSTRKLIKVFSKLMILMTFLSSTNDQVIQDFLVVQNILVYSSEFLSQMNSLMLFKTIRLMKYLAILHTPNVSLQYERKPGVENVCLSSRVFATFLALVVFSQVWNNLCWVKMTFYIGFFFHILHNRVSFQNGLLNEKESMKF